MTVRTFAAAAGVALNVAAAVDVIAPMVVTLIDATFRDWETMTFPE
jgi:hypothetical protein